MVTLLSDMGGRPAASGVDLGLKAYGAPFPAPGTLCGSTPFTSGFFAPSDNDDPTQDCAPACIADAALDANNTSLATFDETDPDGTWELFVSDDCHIDSGNFSGWTLDLTTGPPTPPPSQTSTASPKKCKHKKHKRSAASAKKKCKKKR